MATVTVEGVLKHNSQIRDKMLERNIGKYSQWKEPLSPAIGEYYDIDYNRQLKDLKNGKNMVEFTHDGESDYSKDIEKKYFAFGKKEKNLYSVRDLTPGEYDPWVEFQQGSYTQYIDDVLGKDVVMRHVDYINNLLSGTYIENALRQTEVGVIKDVNVAVAMQGIITTNPNNMSGKDTIMGQISNRTYAQSLYNGAIFNSDRMRATLSDENGDNYLKTYITPSLVNQYGNNLTNVFELSDILRLGANDVRLREDLGKDVHILDGREGRIANINSPEFIFLRKQLKSAKDEWDLSQKNIKSIIRSHIYTPEKNNGYINGTRTVDDWRYDSLDWKDVDKFGTETRGARQYGVYSMTEYNEGENKVDNGSMGVGGSFNEFNEPDMFNSYEAIDQSRESLLGKTSRLFNARKLDTMIARFHNEETKFGKSEFTDTARSSFGNSHGRNLLTLDAATKKPTTNGYSNPYCRTWTYHHQYNQVRKLIRPFVDDNGDIVSNREVQVMNRKYRAYRNDDGKPVVGYEDLARHTVLQDNGFVRISPHSDKSGKRIDNIKDCMFSIENLAWKDVLQHQDNLSDEQRGPNGGRIMWFPPYDLDFQEAVNVNWSQNEFIGRGEKVYTYTNTERTGTLSFSLLIDHPVIINSAVHSEGLGEEKDPEADILRFFAGCELLEENEKIVKPTEGSGGDKVKRTPKEQTIKFKVYFPNNFSGIVSTKDVKDRLRNDSFIGYVESSGETLDGYDEDYTYDYWWRYLLVGNNTCVPTNPDLFRGYEVSLGKGLHDTDTQFTLDKVIYACKDNQYVAGEIPTSGESTCKLGDDTNLKYTYHIDEDLHQKLNYEKSYDDDTSFQMNISFAKLIENHIVNERPDSEYTFAEIILALLGCDKVKATSKYSEILSQYTKFLKDCCGDAEAKTTLVNNVNKLKAIFNDKEVEFTKFSFTGSADANDPDNGDMLSRRRAVACSNLFRRLLGLSGVDLEKIEVDGNGSQGQTGVADKFECKVNRYCEFTITYKTTEVTGLPEQNEDEEEESGTTVTFEQWLDVIKENSPMIKEYCDCLMGNERDVTSIDNGAFEQEMRQYFSDALSGEGGEMDITDTELIRNQIDDLAENYIDKEALILAYAVSDATKIEGINDNVIFRDTYFYDTESGEYVPSVSPCSGGNYVCLQKSTGVDNLIGSTVEDDETDNDYLQYIFAYLLSRNVDFSDYASDEGGVIGKTENPDIDVLVDDDIDTSDDDAMISDDDKFNKYVLDSDGVNNIKWFPVNTGLGALNENMRIYYNDDYETNGYQYIDAHIYDMYISNILIDASQIKDAIMDSERYKSYIKQNTEVGGLMKSVTWDLVRNIEPVESYAGEALIYKPTNINITFKSGTPDENKEYINSRFRAMLHLAIREYLESVGELYDFDAFQLRYVEKYKEPLITFIRGKIFDYIDETYPKPAGCVDFHLKSNLYIHKDEAPDVTVYNIDMDKILVDVIMGHFLRDNIHSFNIETEDVKKIYLVRLCELIQQTTQTPNVLSKGMVKNRGTVDYTRYYNAINSSITVDDEDEDGEVEPCAISLLNEELRQEKERQREEEAAAEQQRINQERAKIEAARLAEEETRRAYLSYGGAYGPSNRVPNMRYEDEAAYFKNIEADDPLLYKNLVDKFKYFNPAYHSISPEGFNARLTFLHQCTRQGQTYEISKTKNSANGYTGTASNLAFGRMPVCVIRIGDFIHTRAIINNMSISYAAANGMVWDLNPEGAGVQPMYAKISLGITLLGGQSLGAPIARLQNAISFNYYANAEAYDNRADVAEYSEREDGNGSFVNYRRIWSPLKKEYIWQKDNNGNDVLTDTGKLYNNYTDDFEAQHSQNGVWKDLTDEEISEGLNGGSQGSGGSDNTSGETQQMVYSPEMSTKCLEYPSIAEFINANYDRLKIVINCNKEFKDANYEKDYSGYEYRYNGYIKPGVSTTDAQLDSQLKPLINDFVMDFVRNKGK